MEEKLISRLESAVTRLESLSAGGFSGGGEISRDASAAGPSIAAFDDLISQYVNNVISVAENIGGQVLDISKVIEEAFNVQKELLVEISQTQHVIQLMSPEAKRDHLTLVLQKLFDRGRVEKEDLSLRNSVSNHDYAKPDTKGLVAFLKPLNDVVEKMYALTEGRQSEFFNHQKTGADSIAALMWIAYTGKNCGMSMPTAHVEESWHTSEFYSNKILVEYKNKDPNHVEWVKVLKELFVPGLKDYVKAHYPLGPVWNASGKTIATNRGGPPPPQAPAAAQSSSSRPKQGMSAVFDEINSGKPVTSGLRKVTADMKSKNRTDRSGVVCVAEKESHAKKPSVTKTGPPKFELQLGRKWVVENQIGQKELVIDDCDAKQTIYVYGCQNCVLQVIGKVNNITLDKCSKMGLVFQDVVAACELVNCNSTEVQCQGVAPTISIDNTEGCQLYLSKYSLETSITTAKSEVNVLIPASQADGDWTEHPLPVQYIHVYKDGQIITTPMDHSGG